MQCATQHKSLLCFCSQIKFNKRQTSAFAHIKTLATISNKVLTLKLEKINPKFNKVCFQEFHMSARQAGSAEELQQHQRQAISESPLNKSISKDL